MSNGPGIARAQAIIVAGGSSRRMGFDKLLALLDGEPVLVHTLRAFQECPDIGLIRLIARADRLDEFQKLAAPFSKVGAVIPGGAERHLSVWAGLQAADPGFPLVAVHDAARPLVGPEDISAAIAAAPATLAVPVADTLKRSGPDQTAGEAVDRTGLWAMQTPQVFALERLREAYTAVMQGGGLVTDEVSAVALLGDRVKLIPPSRFNIKITHPCDIELAHAILFQRRNRTAPMS